VLGHGVNANNQQGSNNTILGYQAGMGTAVHSKSGNIFIGYQAGFYETGDNKLYIENSNISTPLIYGEFDNDLLRINGTLDVNNAYQFPTADGAVGQLLQTDGSGTLSWVNVGGANEINDLSDGKTGGKSVFLGEGAGAVITGYNNWSVGVGEGALEANTSGNTNTAVGYLVMASNTTGYSNTAIGNKALYSNIQGSHHTAVGTFALYSITSGLANTAIGSNALRYTTTGDCNTSVGTSALENNTLGEKNTATGFYALRNITNGTDNTAIGCDALRNATWVNWNTAIGSNALTNNKKNGNTAVGYSAMEENTEGDLNTAIGMSALKNNTTGDYNTIIGYTADMNNETGSYNTIIGFYAGKGTGPHSKSGNVFIGNKAGYYETGSNKLYISNDNTDLPLIYGEFDNKLVSINNNLGLGTKDFGGHLVFAIKDTQIPPSSSIEGVLLYAESVSNSSELKVRDEAGNVTVLSPHNFSMIPKSEPMAWAFYSENHETGKKINVDMLRLIRIVEEVSGEKLASIKNLDDNTDDLDLDENAIGIIQQQQKDIDELKKINRTLLSRIEKLEEK